MFPLYKKYPENTSGKLVVHKEQADTRCRLLDQKPYRK
jgi:hypothetical protein